MSNLLEAAILGTVQGITEFLPISSTGHMVLLQRWFGLNQQVYGLSFDMFTNLGTLTAVTVYFWKDIVKLVSNIRLPKRGVPINIETKQAGWILGTTLLVGLAGLALEGVIATSFRTPLLVGVMLIVFGAVMLAAEAAARRSERQPLNAKRAYAMGLAQAVALIPGVSRSGVTISAGLFAGLDRVTAARFSFLLSLPITAIAVAKRLSGSGPDLAATWGTDVAWFYLTGLATATVAAYFAIHFLLKFLSKHSLAIFAYYRFALGGIVILLAAFS